MQKPFNIARTYYNSTINNDRKHMLLETYLTGDSLNFVFHRVTMGYYPVFSITKMAKYAAIISNTMNMIKPQKEWIMMKMVGQPSVDNVSHHTH